MTRPDTAFAFGFLGRYNDTFDENQWEMTKDVYKYLHHTRDLSLTYKREVGPVLSAFVDSDFAGCKKDGKSTSGFVVLLAGGAVSWYSKKQTTIAQSTADAEYVAAGHLAMELFTVSWNRWASAPAYRL